MIPELAFIGLGSNLGDRRAAIETAIRSMRHAPGIEIVVVSSLIETEPIGPVGQGRYLNGAMKVRTTLPPRALLETCLQIELEQGRDRSVEQRWGPRALDLDVLLYGDLILDEPGLHIPHPRMHERRFVLDPLAEIAPKNRHPGLGMTIEDLRRCLVPLT